MHASDHIRITEEAVRRFVRYSQGRVAPMLLQYSRLIQKGSEEADTSPLFTRATNWHFYNRNLDRDVLHEPVWSFMEPLTFHLSSDRILQKRREQLKEESIKRSLIDCCNLTGRILHHIQDMSTPSHVVPVFHGPLVPDSFENYLNEHYLAADQQLTTVLPELDINPDSLIPRPEMTMLEMYQEAAEETLSLLKPENSTCQATVNGRPTELPWSYFWAARNDRPKGAIPSACSFDGFGTFGPLGKSFGKTEEIRCGDDCYLIDRQVYDGLCRTLMTNTLRNSIRALFLLEPELSRLC